MSEIKLLPDYEVKFQQQSIEHLNYNHLLHDIPEKWRITKGENIKIGILDTGLPTHKDLEGKVKAYKNFTSDPSELDSDGHSTFISGILAGESKDTNIGIIGIAPKSELYIAKVIGASGGGNDKSLANAIYWCLEQGVDIINMSLGAPASLENKFAWTRQAVLAAAERNIFMFAAAGNDGVGSVDVPAKWNEVFAIAAVDNNQVRATFSNFGPEIDFSGMGVDLVSTYLNNTYSCLSGTSFAGPDIAAIAALILSEHKNDKEHQTPINNFMDLRMHLVQLCTDLGDGGWDANYGWGLVTFGKPSANLNYKDRYGLVDDQKIIKLPWYKRIFKIF